MNVLRKTSLFSLLLTLCLTVAALTCWAAAAGPQLVVSSQPSASQTVGFAGLSDDCQSFQATFTLSHAGSSYTFTADPALADLPGVYTTYRQDGANVTVYVTAKRGTLPQNGNLTLGTLTADDAAAFTVEKVTDINVVDTAHSDTTYPPVDQDGSTGNSGESSKPDQDTGSSEPEKPNQDTGNSGTGDSNQNTGDIGTNPPNQNGNSGTGSTDQSTGIGGNSGSVVPTHPITVQLSSGGRVTASAAQAAQGQKITLTVLPNSGYVLKSLAVVDRTGKSVALTEQSGGKYTFPMPASAVTVTAVFEAQPPVTPQMPFTDVPAGSWYFDAVGYVFERGLMGGTGNGRFSPDLTTSRAMIVTILYRLEGSPAPSGSTFSDVAPGQWYSDGVAWASANGIVTGYPDGRFGPDDTITREQMASILYRYAKYKGYDVTAQAGLERYSDAGQVAPYAADAMGWAVSSGVITGTSGTTLSPAGSATRAQAAVILARFCQDVAG